MLAAIFVSSGLNAFLNPGQLAQRSKPVTDRVGPLVEKASLPLPTDAESLVRLNGATQMVGGALLLSRHFSRPGAALLAASLVPTTVAGHPFWRYPDRAERIPQQVQFLKNLGLLGGLLLAAADTGGRPALSWRAARLAGRTRHSAQRAARTARRETKLAVRSANLGRHLPH